MNSASGHVGQTPTAIKKFQMVAFDLDGTLLGPDHQISQYAIQYLRALHDRGFLITIATGRLAASVADVIRRLNLTYPAPHRPRSSGFPVVCTNGVRGGYMVYEPFPEDGVGDDHDARPESDGAPTQSRESNPMMDGRMRLAELFHCPVPPDLTRKTIAVAKGIGCVTNYYIGNDIYAQLAEEWHRDATEKYAQLTGQTFTYCKDDYAAAMERSPSSKLLVLCRPEDVDATCRTLERELGTEANVIPGSPLFFGSQPFFVEVLRRDVCKGNGLALLCDKMNVRLEECIAFGDGENDLEFLEMAGLGVAMLNGRDTVKTAADAVTQHTNAEDGAIRFLQQLESEGRLQFASV